MAIALESPEDLKSLIKECMADTMKSHAEHMDEISKKVDDLCSKAEAIGTDDTPVKEDKSAADLEKEEGKAKDESPNGFEDSDKEEEKKDDEKEKKDMSAKPSIDLKAFKAELLNDLMKTFANQRKSPPASATAGSPESEKALETKPKYKTYHEACRAVHALGKNTKTESMKLATEQNPALYTAYCKGQENGEAWTREALFMTPEKKQRNLTMIATGRLL